MLTFNDAKKIGIKACIDMLGYDFVKKYEDKACTAYSDEGDHASCFVGVDTTNISALSSDGHLILDDTPAAAFPFSVSCNVAYKDGTVTNVIVHRQ